MSYVYRGKNRVDETPTPETQHQARDGRKHHLAPCGTLAAYKRHKRMGEEACDPCKDANAVAVAKFRGGTTTGARRSKAAECGTYSGTIRHRRAGEQPCFACRLAESRYRQGLKARRTRTLETTTTSQTDQSGQSHGL